jgi:hypothetical protein
VNLRAGILLVGGGLVAGVAAIFALRTQEREIKDIEPDALPPPPGGTKWKGVNAILGKLQAAAQSTGIPLGLMVGWIGMESGGKLSDTTSLDERGYFQLMPDESKSIGVDHQRLSTDADYSIDAGIKLIRKYQSTINNLGFPAGTSFYWRLVKLAHSMGSGQVNKVVKAAKDAGAAGSWDDLEQFALGMKINGPQPKKWFPFVDKVYAAGRPFGFGSESMTNVGFYRERDGLDYFGVDEV